MIHRHLVNVQAFDAMFLTALATAAYIHVGQIWLVYVICIMGVTSLFTMMKGSGTYYEYIGDQINFLAKCVRDKQIKLSGKVDTK